MRQHQDTELELVIVEAYYNYGDQVEGTTDRTYAMGNTIEELRPHLEYMLKALDEPVLDEQTALAAELTDRDPDQEAYQLPA